MEIIRPELNDEIQGLIMGGLSPEAEVRPVFDPGDVGVWQNQNGKIVNYYHADPNRDTAFTDSGLGILSVDEDGKKDLIHQWQITRWSTEESLIGKPLVEVKYTDFTTPRGREKTRYTNNPNRTYLALARLAKIHLGAGSASVAE